MEKTKLTVAVTGLNNTDNPGPGVPVIRSLRESSFFDVRIIGLAYENLEPGIYMKDIVDKAYLIPYPSSGQDALMNRIREINERENVDVLIPNFDAELYTFMKSEKQLEEIGIRSFLPTLQQFEERHKTNLPAFGEKYDIKVPASKAITSHRDIASGMILNILSWLKENFTMLIWPIMKNRSICIIIKFQPNGDYPSSFRSLLKEQK